ncbi:hypothetical protein H0W80_04750 [Candidatus Saccharibacteria bacterium]|nr:hypothetical protein [Candidatus Saccharibacteria bacterium]
MSNPEYKDDFTKTPESQAVLTQVGKRFYNQCQYYECLFASRRLIAEGKAQGINAFDNQVLNDFTSKSGKTTEYTNSRGQLCSITRREGVGGTLGFSIYSVTNDEEGYGEPGDTCDTYLLSETGNILATEHLLIKEDRGDNFSPIPINPEELLHKIDTDFRPAPQTDLN